MGRTSTLLENQNSGVITAITGNAVSAGDIVYNTSYGRAETFNSYIPSSFNNTATDGPATVVASNLFESGSYYNTSGGDEGAEGTCELDNKNIVITYTGNGTNNNTNVNFRIRTPYMSNVVDRTIVSTSANIRWTKAFKISATRFIVLFYVSGSSQLSYRIYNNDGTPVTSVITISTSTLDAHFNGTALLLQNGNFLIAYKQATTSYPVYRIIDSSGNSVLAETVLSTTASDAVTAKQLANGNIAFSYMLGAAHYASIMNQSGSLISSSVILTSSTNTNLFNYSSAPSDGMIYEFSNGNIAFVTSSATNSSFNAIKIYNSTLTTTVKTIDLASSTSTPSARVQAIQYLFSCDFVADKLFYGFMYSTNAAVNILQLSSVGNVEAEYYRATINNQGSTTPTAGSKMKIKYLGNNICMLYASLYTGTNYTITLNIFNGILNTTLGTDIVIKLVNTNTVSPTCCLFTSLNQAIAINANGSTGNYIGDYNYCAKSILGVAAETAAANSQIRIATKGNFATNQNTGGGITFNNQTATVPGTKGIVVGTTAVLSGAI